MCFLIACDHFPSDEMLKAGRDQNRDGIGIAYKTNKGIKWNKGIDFDTLMAYKELKVPMLIHFRAASRGTAITPELCHPFPITEDLTTDLKGTTDAVFAHNGYITGWKDLLLQALMNNNIKCPPGDWSDTRAMALLVHLKSMNFLNLFSDKFAVLDKQGIHRFGEWFKVEDGIFISYDIFSHKNHKNKNHTPVTSMIPAAGNNVGNNIGKTTYFKDGRYERISWVNGIRVVEIVEPTPKVNTAPDYKTVETKKDDADHRIIPSEDVADYLYDVYGITDTSEWAGRPSKTTNSKVHENAKMVNDKTYNYGGSGYYTNPYTNPREKP